MNVVKNEPIVSAVVAVIAASAALLVAFGVPLTETQIGAVSGEAVAVIGLGLLVRAKVTPVANPKVVTTSVVPLVVPGSPPLPAPDAEPTPTPTAVTPPATQSFPSGG